MMHETDFTRVDLNLLVLFEAVLQTGHVGRAGARLHLSPSAVSHGLSRLRLLLNDPLFLKHPKGVLPSARALALAEPIGDILSRVRGVVGGAQPFDPARARRRFTLGAPDGVATVILPPLLARIPATAPGVDISVRAQMPHTVVADLDAGGIDIAMQPVDSAPPRFRSTRMYEEDFVICMRKDNPLAKRLTLQRYCAASHVLVSLVGDPSGNIDAHLAGLGLSRRVAVTVPNFLSALAVVAETDLLAAAPQRLAAAHASSFGCAIVKNPVMPPMTPIHAIASKAALADAGVAWMFDMVLVSARAL
jgi:DNA-binding transcriptional LysR family regulator